MRLTMAFAMAAKHRECTVPIAGHLHDIQGCPGEALCKLSKVFWEMADSHAALPIEGLHVVHQEQRAQPCCCMSCKPYSQP